MCPMHGPSRRPWGHAAFLAVMRHAAWWAVGAVVLATGSQAAAESLSTPNTPDSIKALIKICEPSGSGLPPGEESQNCYAMLLHEILRTQGPTIAMLTLYQLADASPGFGNFCHVAAHHLSLCAAVEPHLRSDCYYYFIALVSWASRGSVPAMFASCETLSSETKPGCYRGIGRALVAQYVEREDELMRLCRSGQEAYAADCLLGFASNLVTARGLDRGFAFCAKLAEEARIRCSKDLGVAIRLRWTAKDRIKAECRKAGEELYVRACVDVKLNAGEPILRTP